MEGKRREITLLPRRLLTTVDVGPVVQSRVQEPSMLAECARLRVAASQIGNSAREGSSSFIVGGFGGFGDASRVTLDVTQQQ